MTEYRATPEQWTQQEKWVRLRPHDSEDSACLLELRARVEALEVQHEARRLATLVWGKDVDNHSRWIDDHLKRIMALEAGQEPKPSPEVDRVRDLQDRVCRGESTLDEAMEELIALDRTGPLVERVAGAIDHANRTGAPAAPAVIREVAAWIGEQDPEPGRVGRWLGQVATPCGVMADLLRQQADR